MSIPEEKMKELCVDILENEDAVAATTGVFQHTLEHAYSVDLEYDEVRELLEEMRDDGVLEYHHGEFGEFAFAEEGRE